MNMGHNSVLAILTFPYELKALVTLAYALADKQPEAQLYLICLFWLPNASIVHLTFISESQISPPSFHSLLLV